MNSEAIISRIKAWAKKHVIPTNAVQIPFPRNQLAPDVQQSLNKADGSASQAQLATEVNAREKTDGALKDHLDNKTLHTSVGGYEPPAGGIPKEDLSPDVQTSLDKANSALQEETDPAYTQDKDSLALKTEITSAVNSHKNDTTAHDDIRTLIDNIRSLFGTIPRMLQT
jgi:hypothetical protein